MKTAADLDRIAKERGFHVQDTGLFLRDEPIDGLGPSPGSVGAGVSAGRRRREPGAARVARLGLCRRSRRSRNRTCRSWPRCAIACATISCASAPPRSPRPRRPRLPRCSRARADFAAAAKKAGLEVKPTELIARGAPHARHRRQPGHRQGRLPAAGRVGVSDPISTPQGTAIVRVAEKEAVTDAQIAAGMDQTRDELVNQRRDRFFSGYMVEGEGKAEDCDQPGDAGARGRPVARRPAAPRRCSDSGARGQS